MIDNVKAVLVEEIAYLVKERGGNGRFEAVDEAVGGGVPKRKDIM